MRAYWATVILAVAVIGLLSWAIWLKLTPLPQPRKPLTMGVSQLPLHDVNDAFDPSFIDTCTIYRIIESVGQNGRVYRQRTPHYNVPVVIVPSSPQDLQRLPDFQLMAKSITIYSPSFRLQGPVVDKVSGNQTTHPDEVDWHGSTFVVRHMEDFSGYGRGFTMAIAESIQAVDGPPIPAPIGSA